MFFWGGYLIEPTQSNNAVVFDLIDIDLSFEKKYQTNKHVYLYSPTKNTSDCMRRIPILITAAKIKTSDVSIMTVVSILNSRLMSVTS